jgi:hypothetical protein
MTALGHSEGAAQEAEIRETVISQPVMIIVVGFSGAGGSSLLL